LDLKLPAGWTRGASERGHWPALKCPEPEPIDQAPFHLCLQDPLALGPRHEAIQSVNERLSCQTRCDEQSGITMWASIEAPASKATTLCDVSIGGVSHGAKYAR